MRLLAALLVLVAGAAHADPPPRAPAKAPRKLDADDVLKLADLELRAGRVVREADDKVAAIQREEAQAIAELRAQVDEILRRCGVGPDEQVDIATRAVLPRPKARAK